MAESCHEVDATIGRCIKCNKIEDLRYGLCFDCAGKTSQEEWELLWYWKEEGK